MTNPEIDPPSAGTPAPAGASTPAAASTPVDSPAPAARNRRTAGLIAAVLVLIVVLCCICLLAAGIVWYMRQGNPPLFEDMLQVWIPGFVPPVT